MKLLIIKTDFEWMCIIQSELNFAKSIFKLTCMFVLAVNKLKLSVTEKEARFTTNL